jgi:hypothetical protein
MGNLLRKLAIGGYKASKKINDIDLTHPFNQDTAAFLIDVLKEIIKPL